MNLDKKALELRGQFLQKYSVAAGEEEAIAAFENAEILSGINAFFKVVSDIHKQGFDGYFDTTEKPEIVLK